MSQQYFTYKLEADSDFLRCYCDSPTRPLDFFVRWPDVLSGEEEPGETELSEAKDIITEDILRELNQRGLILVGDFPALMHAVYVTIAPGGGFVHPQTFSVYESESLLRRKAADRVTAREAQQELRIARSDVRRERYRTEVGRLDRIDQLADRMLLEDRYADVPATQVWDIAAGIIDNNGRSL
jgi:hypothetical protein